MASRTTRTSLWLWLGAIALVGSAAGAPTSRPQGHAEERPAPTPTPRAAVERSVPLLQASAQTWLERRACTSCHHQSLGTLAVLTARGRGVAIDEALHAKQLARMQRHEPGSLDEALLGEANINGQIGQPHRLLALAASGIGRSQEAHARFHFLAGKQHADGRWPSESHRPPHEDTAFTATALAVRALQLHAPHRREAEVRARVARARSWLAHARPRDNEDRVMRLFGLRWSGGTPEELAEAREALLRTQREDGGWAQHDHRPSDAYATGSALVALNQAAGLATTAQAFARGVAYLTRSQHEDGSWLVETRRKTDGLEHVETGFPHGEHQFISFAGTAWAVSALSLALEVPVSSAGPSAAEIWQTCAPLPIQSPPPTEDSPVEAPQTEERTQGLTALMGAVLDGMHTWTVTLLERGTEDVNATTAHGVTALHIAAGDIELARLLVEHGAAIDARSTSGKTPLFVAAAHGSGGPVVRLLLERGADPNAATPDGYTPLIAAALGGDQGSVALLLEHGATLEHTTDDGASALLAATWQHDASLVAFLLAHGARADGPVEGVAPLLLVAVDGSPELGRVLLAAGANPNVRGEGEATPLHRAALVDFGDTGMLEALIAAGADLDARDASGSTPLEIALRHGNAAHVAALRRARAGR